ncbi:MAG: phosphoribosylanthranilate isomerase, partial [Candidatus Odinarchaeia archaeon]
MSVKVKICGFTRKKDLEIAIKAGADMIGVIVKTPTSSRNISVEKASKLFEIIPKKVEKVVVTTCQNENKLIKICKELKPSIIQLYT